jgi:hypothetical protein
MNASEIVVPTNFHCGSNGEICLGNGNIAARPVAMRLRCMKDVACFANRLHQCSVLTAKPFRTLWWVVSLPTWLHLIEARLDVCVCSVAAITSVFGMVRHALNAREKWKKREKRNFGHDANIRGSHRLKVIAKSL